VVDLDAAVEEHEFQIAVADGEHQIPSHGPKDPSAVNWRDNASRSKFLTIQRGRLAADRLGGLP
jgi:hypothetical protein